MKIWGHSWFLPSNSSVNRFWWSAQKHFTSRTDSSISAADVSNHFPFQQNKVQFLDLVLHALTPVSFSDLISHCSVSISWTFQSFEHLKVNQALVLTPAVASIYKDPPGTICGRHLLTLFGRKTSRIKIITENKIPDYLNNERIFPALPLSSFSSWVLIWNSIFASKLIISCSTCCKFYGDKSLSHCFFSKNKNKIYRCAASDWSHDDGKWGQRLSVNGSSQQSTETSQGHSRPLRTEHTSGSWLYHPIQAIRILEFREALPEKGSITCAHARILSTLVILEGSGLEPPPKKC